MLTIYGGKMSRAARCMWVLEELGVPYRQVLVPDAKAPAYLALNPMGKVPTLADGDFVLTESVAINAWLAARHATAALATSLLPADVQVRARIDQWTSWAITEVEFHFTTMVREVRRATQAGETPDAAIVGQCLANVAATLTVLEQHLDQGREWVAGDGFTLGDINAAFPIAMIAPRLDMAAFPHVAAWLGRCTARPAWQRVMARDESGLDTI